MNKDTRLYELLWRDRVASEYVVTQGFDLDDIESNHLTLCRRLSYSETLIISAFPGTGKTFFKNKTIKVLDSDSSLFSKENFPDNYIHDILSNIGLYDVIFVSSHKEVRDALNFYNIDYVLCYPNIKCQVEYIFRFLERGSSIQFTKLISDNWSNWLTEIKNQKKCFHVELYLGQFISDILTPLSLK